MPNKLTTEEFIKKAKIIHGNNYDYSAVNYINKYTKVKLFCNICKTWFEQSPRHHLICKNCPCCRKNLQIQTNWFISRALKIHGNKYDYTHVKYKKNKAKVKILCKICNRFFLQAPGLHLQGKGCPICGNVIRKTQSKFIKEAKRIHGTKYNYDQAQYYSNHKKVKIFCNKCKKYFWQGPANHLHGSGCPYCNPCKKLTIEEFITKANKLHKNYYDYSKTIYHNHRTKILIICKRCHNTFEQKANCHLNGQGCPYCKQSKGELQIQKWLSEHDIKHERQKRFTDCRDKKPLPFDFYLPDHNLCIEFQGQQHYKEGFDIFIKRYKDQEIAILKYKKQRYRDRIKRKYCKDNNIRLVEIKYNQNIEKRLSLIFNRPIG